MKKNESRKISKAVQTFKCIAEEYRDVLPADIIQRVISSAHGLRGIIIDVKERAQSVLEEVEVLESQMDDPNIQNELFDDEGRSLEEVEAARLAKAEKEQARADKKAEKERSKLKVLPGGKSDTIDPKDGQQLTLGEAAVASSTELPNGVSMSWSVTPGIPTGVEMGLIQALRDGDGQRKAVKKVAKATTLTEIEVSGHWDTLVRNGRIAKGDDGNWLAHLPEEMPNGATIG